MRANDIELREGSKRLCFCTPVARRRCLPFGQLKEVNKVAQQGQRDSALVFLRLARFGCVGELLRDHSCAITNLVRHASQRCNLSAVGGLGNAINEAVSVGVRSIHASVSHVPKSPAYSWKVQLTTHVKITSRLSSSTSTCMCLLLTREYESKSYARLV